MENLEYYTKKTDGMLWDSQCETDLFEGKIKIADIPVEFRTRRAYICAHRYARWIGDEKERHHQLWKIAESLEADICNFEIAQTMREHGVPTPEIEKKVGAKIPEESDFFNLDERLQELILIHDSASIRSPEPDVDGVSDSPYTSNYLMTDGQLKKLAAVSPSIDDAYYNYPTRKSYLM